jgi:PPIC-type PPIASE domain
MKQIVTRLLREPLLQFFVVGGLFFAVFAMGGGSNDPQSDVIEISAARVEQLSAQFSSAWNREPTAEELENIINAYIREEVYYRDALELGLDRNDTVIRQRLRQKMEFLTDTGASLMEPTPDELKEYYAANEATYVRRSRVAVQQVFLGEEPSPSEIESTLSQLISDPEADTSLLGERTMLPASLRLTLAEGIDAVFGQGFFTRIKDLPDNTWSGPFTSTYGNHLVRIVQREPATAPPLEDIRDAVSRDWRASLAEELRKTDYERRLAKYSVDRTYETVPDPAVRNE